MFKRSFMMFVVFVGVAFLAFADESQEKKMKATAIADEIINMRSSLAKTFIKPDIQITEETFKSVCGAVGKRVKEISEREGIKIRHAATKNRNPMNATMAGEAEILSKFEKDKNLKEIWDIYEENVVGNGYYRYYSYIKPIFVEETCLACHGAKDKRPQFVIDKYPADKAYDFKVRDLRGMISIMIPITGEQK